MNILCLNQDKGINPSRKKGAAVHVQAIRKAFTALGHHVFSIDDPSDAALTDMATRIDRGTTQIDMVYERYALHKSQGSLFAFQHRIPHILEVNAPLAFEAVKWRGAALDHKLERLEQKCFSNAHHVIAVSADTRRYSIDRGAPDDRVTVIANGFDPSSFYPRDKLNAKKRLEIPLDHTVIGFHGRLRPWHRFEDLIAAMVSLESSGNNLHLLTIGKGPYLDQAAPHLAREHHTHLDWIDNESLGDYVGAYDIIPLMYAFDEPCYFSPLKLYEAMACGAVPVVPDISGIKEFVEHGVTGLVYGPGGLAESIGQLNRNPDGLAQLSAASIEASKAHTWKCVAEETLTAAGFSV